MLLNLLIDELRHTGDFFSFVADCIAKMMMILMVIIAQRSAVGWRRAIIAAHSSSIVTSIASMMIVGDHLLHELGFRVTLLMPAQCCHLTIAIIRTHQPLFSSASSALKYARAAWRPPAWTISRVIYGL